MAAEEGIRIDPALIPSDVLRIVEALRPGESYIVGGIVREMTLSLIERGVVSPRLLAEKDWDIATSCRPHEAMKRLKRAGFAVLPIGIDHGTVVAHGRKPGGEVDPDRRYEITTYRFDQDCDGRHAVVRFADTLEDDLARRDFTVNAMALDPGTGRILDLHGGLNDLKARTLRCVGNPEERFREDYLRMLRAIRFASAIEGEIERSTWEALCKQSEGIDGISRERVRDELMRLLTYPRPSKGLLLMHESGLLARVFPELDRCFGVSQNQYHADDVGIHTLLVADAIHPRYPLLRFTALVHDLGKVVTREFSDEKSDYTFYNHEVVGARIAGKVMQRLRFSREEIEFAQRLTRIHMYPFDPPPSKKTVRRWLSRVGPENFRPLIRLKIADRVGNRRQPRRLEPGTWQTIRLLREIERDRDALTLRDLKINGNDLIAMGMSPGPLLGEILNSLMEQVLDDPSCNRRELLLERAEKLVQNRLKDSPDSGE